MKRWSGHGTRILLLAVLLGLGISLSWVQGGGMTAEVAFATDGACHGPGGCDGCDHDGMGAGACPAICGSAAQGLMPLELLTQPPASRTDFEIVRLHLSGRFHSPDHGPPKILTLG